MTIWSCESGEHEAIGIGSHRLANSRCRKLGAMDGFFTSSPAFALLTVMPFLIYWGVLPIVRLTLAPVKKFYKPAGFSQELPSASDLSRNTKRCWERALLAMDEAVRLDNLHGHGAGGV
jgi:hypothetical protein